MSTTMLYKFPGSVRLCHISGDKFDYIEVPDEEVKTHLKDGWSLTQADAKEKHEKTLKKSKAANDEAQPEPEPEA